MAVIGKTVEVFLIGRISKLVDRFGFHGAHNEYIAQNLFGCIRGVDQRSVELRKKVGAMLEEGPDGEHNHSRRVDGGGQGE